MTDVVQVAIVAAIPATVAALLTAWSNRQIKVVHDAVNGGLGAARQEVKETRAELATAIAEIKSLKAERDARNQ